MGDPDMAVSAAANDFFEPRDDEFSRFAARGEVPPLTDEKPLKPWAVAGLTVLGLGLVAAAVGGVVWWVRKRKAEAESRAPIKIEPSGPPRPAPAPAPDPARANDPRPPSHAFVGKAQLHPDLAEELAGMFGNAWPPDKETVDNLQPDDVVVFAAEGVPTGNFTEPRQELITAQVLSVEETHVRGRVKGPVEYAAHFAAHPGHGLEVGESVEVPRSKILVAARQKAEESKPIGYDSQGKSIAQLKPTSLTTKVHAVKPGTPYDLVLPYRTERLVWQVKAKDNLVTMIQIGEKGLLEQIKFTEGSLRGTFSVVLLNDDPKDGLIFVARWDLDLQA
jgi:hypothetical protein